MNSSNYLSAFTKQVDEMVKNCPGIWHVDISPIIDYKSKETIFIVKLQGDEGYYKIQINSVEGLLLLMDHMFKFYPDIAHTVYLEKISGFFYRGYKR